MQNRRIYTIGETVYDIIFRDGQPVAARAGGAMLNSAVSLGRLNLPVDLVSEIARDEIGGMIIRFLDENGVGTRNIYRYDNGKTPLALAFLDELQEAHYTFYKQYPDKRLKAVNPEFHRNDIVMFGSFAAITEEFRKPLLMLIKKAKDAGALVMYDPNFRKPHLPDLSRVKPYIIENIGLADIVRGSTDDFSHIFNAWNTQEAFYHVNEAGCHTMICTTASDPVHFRSNGFNLDVEIPTINPISTIGAGDAFNAGLIYGLMKLKVGTDDIKSLKKQQWETLLEIGVAFGTTVCESYDNYISFDFASRLTR